jgi:G3E family GTPase
VPDLNVSRVPVTIVTGFLGSGKTTLIAAMLRRPDLAGMAVIVNEFGDIGIDDAIFADATGPKNVRLLASGCMCCLAGDDLVETLLDLVRGGPSLPVRIIVETTGLADPAKIMRQLMTDLRLRAVMRLDGVVTTIDAVNGIANLEKYEVCRAQAAFADLRIVTKSDLTETEAVVAVIAKLQVINNGSRIVVADHGEIDARLIFGLSLVDATTGQADLEKWLNVAGHRTGRLGGSIANPTVLHFSGSHQHGDGMGTWLIEDPRPVEWERLEQRVGDIIRRHGHNLLRLKGVVRTLGDDRPLVLHGVQHVFHAPVRLKSWQSEASSAIVAIGRDQTYAAVRELRAAWSDCAE